MQVEEYIVQIIQNQMALPNGNIWIASQNRKIPTNSNDLFCIIGTVNFRPISSKSRFNDITLQEEQTVYGRADVQIDLMSRSNEARERRFEILMALNSFYSKNIQDANCFRIFELPRDFINTSGLQGGSDINRFTLIIPTMVSQTKIISADYYDTFSGEIMTEQETIDLNISE